MAQTVIPVGDPRALKRWSARLASDTPALSFFGRKMMGRDENNIIHEDVSLASAAGDEVQFDLSANISGSPVVGDDVAEGKEKRLQFYSDTVKIDQARMPVSTGGRMTAKRTLHNLREVAKRRSSEYWAAWIDQLIFMYLSGARGANAEFHEPTSYTGHAGNAFAAPDNAHVLYGGSATSKATIASTDKFNRVLVERAETHAKMMKAADNDSTRIMPVTMEGGEHFAIVMSPWQEHDMRVADTTGWVEIQKAAAAAEGRKNPLFMGALGMIKRVVLQAHEHVIRFTDYGSGANVAAARALFLGRQAGILAYGTNKGLRYDWQEELKDYKNQVNIASGVIIGFKKSRFNNKDFGVIALDTAAANPNP